MDVTKQITMNDANEGEGTLSGFLGEVPLRCGDVLTYANIYIGEKAPFNLLLGRSWQRGNYITIDERLEGTFHVFKDRNLNSQWEMIVSSEMIQDPMNAEFYQNPCRQPSSMFFGKGPTPKLELEYGPLKNFRRMMERTLAGIHLLGSSEATNDAERFEIMEEEPKKISDTEPKKICYEEPKKICDYKESDEPTRTRQSWLARLKDEIRLGENSRLANGLASVRANVEAWGESYSKSERERMRKHLMLALDFPEGLVQKDIDEDQYPRSRTPDQAPSLDPLGLIISERQHTRMEWADTTICATRRQDEHTEPMEQVFLSDINDKEGVGYVTTSGVPMIQTKTKYDPDNTS